VVGGVVVTAHFLVVHEFDPASDEWFDVEHPDDCPLREWFLDAPGALPELVLDCDVAMDGIDTYFRHADDPDPDPWYREAVVPVPVGRHEIEAWFHRAPAGPWGPEEWDGGLRLVAVS